MDRRQVLATFGVGIGGLSGCLRLTGADSGATSTGEADASTDGQSTGTNDERAGSGTASAVTLAENWTGDWGIDFVWTDAGDIYFNDYNAAIKAQHGGGIEWANEATYEGFEDNLGDDAFGTDGEYATFGFTPDPEVNDTLGSHFHAYDVGSGEKLWAFGMPAGGKHNLAEGATIVDGIAVVAAGSSGSEREQEPLVVGLDAESGDALWQTDKSTLPTASINYVGNHDESVYVGMSSDGFQVLDPETGELTEVHESWSVTRGPEAALGQFHSDTFFAADWDGLRAYPVGDTGREWANTELDGDPSAGPVVDNSLAVTGTDAGSVYALDRSTGEVRWEASIDGTVGSIATSGLRVWVADRATGLTAYDRTDGTLLHRSTKPVNGADITVVDNVVLLGGDQVHAYTIREE
ncbi:hypothetical protein D3D02_05280 [Halobellus sp. Atlit-38R]|jgi:hypothetical protein|uniref:outer membrane protein assembly factor BamB family protein n=1 Tax=Halobellus sp. Atlit-38R TaxID=2282131 RepID=UPI000EF246AC|nr:PQQ-binding-like beta-propeller repeat protein [Halobellus sp. Atlit-38R]RLM90184.1 hypothetical protein D3D02_05280 [Halobellus sp. Atlit-38R]